MFLLYFFFFLGTGLILFYKWITYVLYGKKLGTSVSASTRDWFFDPSLNNSISWTTTIAFGWAVSYIYIGRVEFSYLSWLGSFPLHPSISLFLGVITEIIAPSFVKWLVSKVVP